MTTRHWGYFKTAAFDQNRWRPGSASSRWSSRRRTRSTEATSTPTTTATTSNHLWTRRRCVSSRKETRRRKAGKTSTDEAIIMLRYLRIRTRIFFPFLSLSGLFRPKQCSFVGVHFSSFFFWKDQKMTTSRARTHDLLIARHAISCCAHYKRRWHGFESLQGRKRRESYPINCDHQA